MSRRGVGLTVAGGLLLLTLILDGSLRLVGPERLATLVVLFGVGSLLGALAWLGLRRTLFLALPYLVAFVAVEAGFRLWLANVASPEVRRQVATAGHAADDLGRETVYAPHHYTLYTLRPHYRSPEGTVHNRLGFRDARDLADKPPGTVRVVFIGGSTTYTIGIKDNARIFSRRLEDRLNAHYRVAHAGTVIEVINAGLGASTSAENLLRLIFFVSEVQPDLVVIHHGLNDVWPRLSQGLQSDFGNYRRRWGPPDHLEHRPIAAGLLRIGVERSAVLTYLGRVTGWLPATEITEMTNRTDVPVADAYLAENDTRYFERNTRFMIAVSRAMGARVLLASEAYTDRAGPARRRAMPEHNAILARLAQQEGVAFFDYAAVMPLDDRHLPDGRHVSPVGSDVKADLFFRYFLDHGLIPPSSSPVPLPEKSATRDRG